MLKKGSKLYSILTGTCPKCQNESMYVNKNPYIISEIMKMHEHCSHCGLKYKIEPNFFFGAMYVSYAAAVLVGMILFAFTNFVLKTNLGTSFMTIIIGLLLLMPYITRVSRNIYINLFVHYDKRYAKKS
ncbi:MAG TPA: DUF983 domain-containing protein [Flavobacterium sp.]|nr:DUF983 domain-containing protein [Flavobacterium sp.]